MNVGMAYLEYSRRGGIERSSAELADRLAARSIEVHYYCSKFLRSVPTRVQFHQVRTIGPVNSMRLISFALNARKSLRRAGYDITHSHGNVVGCDVITAHSCHRAALQALQQHAGAAAGGIRNLGIADRFRLLVERRNFGERNYRRIIAVSEGVKRELCEHYLVPPDDIEVIPNGVDLAEFSPEGRERHRISTRARFGFGEGDHVLLFVANEYRRKGLLQLVEALSLLVLQNVRLLVIGNDDQAPYRRRAQAIRVDDRVFFVGPVSDIAPYYAASDLFVLPTTYEAFSEAMLEAAACGLPLMMTKVNGSEEFIREGYNGVFISREPRDIARRIGVLLESPEKLRTLGDNARRSAEPYNWDSVVNKTLRVYERVMKER